MSDDTLPTPVADHPHLRLLAEWSSSLRGRPATFAARRGALWLADADPRADEPALRVPAATAGRYGAVRSLSIRVAGADAPLDLAAWGADAVFWSESAVEKFVVPYYASCAGARAGELLTTLMDAWNGGHGAVRPVALAHLGHAAGDAPLTLAGTLGVVFLDGDAARLDLLPLRVFRARHGGRWTPRPAPAPADVALPPRPLPEGARLPAYPELRGIAEWASALRGRTAYLAYDAAPPSPAAAAGGRVRRVRAPEEAPPGSILFPVHTPLEVPERPKPVEVLLETEGGATADLVRDPHCDAVFTSSGAIEQLLVPYYASVRGALAMRELRQVFLAWADPALEPATLRGDRLEPPPALVHLPRSDWDAVDGGGALEAGSPLDHLGVVRPDARVVTVRRATA